MPETHPAQAGGESLWCVHVIGPDDVHAAPDLRTAATWAHKLNECIAERVTPQEAADDYVMTFANVAPWEGSAESHAAALPRAIADMTPRVPPDADTPFKKAFTALARTAERAGNREIVVGPTPLRLDGKATLPWTMTLRREDAALARRDQTPACGVEAGGRLDQACLRKLIRKHGGEFHGPRVEHLSMEEQAFWRFLDEVIALAAAAPQPVPASREAGESDTTFAPDHEFKSHPSVFWPAVRGTKTFEYRRDDRGGYHVGQTVRLRCYDPGIGYTDDPPADRRITDILYGGQFELPDGYCILGLAPLAATPQPGSETGGGDDEYDPDEPIPGFNCSPYGMSPVLMNFRLRKQSRPFTDEDRAEAAALIDRLVAQIEVLEASAPDPTLTARPLADAERGALEDLGEPELESFAINPAGGPDIIVEGGRRFVHERDALAYRAWAKDTITRFATPASTPALAGGETEQGWEPIASSPRDATVQIVVEPRGNPRTYAVPAEPKTLPAYIDEHGQVCCPGTWKPDPGLNGPHWRAVLWRHLSAPPSTPGAGDVGGAV